MCPKVLHCNDHMHAAHMQRTCQSPFKTTKARYSNVAKESVMQWSQGACYGEQALSAERGSRLPSSASFVSMPSLCFGSRMKAPADP